jgi:GNAT superfamily N-acetyltransferase
MARMDCTVRTMHRHEVPLAIDWAAQEGWNPGLHDAACFHAADPGGFLIAEVGGQPAGCVSAVSYAGRFGFIGLYIVAPAWRGQGIGLRLWNAAMARLSGHVIGLDGVPAQQANYRRSGFMPAWNNARMSGVAGPNPAGASPRIIRLADVDFATLCRKDRSVFPAPRDAFLRAWSTMPDSTGLAWLDNGELRGWGVVRQCRHGHKIGPLVADTPAIASALFGALGDALPAGDAVFLDVPMPNRNAIALAEANGMRCVFDTARMYTDPAPECKLETVYGITTFELG